jgi:hypothetical protein
MRKLSMIVVMSLALVVGLWGYSRSENRPTVDRSTGITIDPSEDHPWGGDQGNGGGLKSSDGAIRPKPKLEVITGNTLLDVVMNRLILRSVHMQKLLISIPETNVTVTPGTANSTPAGGNSGNGVN